MQKIKIEVGANFGHDTEYLANDGSIVYAFEPTHELLNHLWDRFKDNTNIKVLPFAVDIENGFANFKIAGHHDWGCSSLYNFSGDWEREDFYVTHSYDVPKITLFDFCNMYNINKIDYLWIDAQGNDFNCLLSLKDKINIVKAGQCEVGMDKMLYNDNKNHISFVKPWLEENGFIVDVEPDGTGAECNLKFRKI
jgi:FkbM family methyltransferase